MSEIDFTKEIWANHDDYPKVLVLGTFDLLHQGHFEFLKAAAKLGKVIVGLGTDPHQIKYKRKPVLTYWERKAALELLPWVTAVVKRDTVNVKSVVNMIQPKYMPYGSDWELNDWLDGNGLNRDQLDRWDITVVRIPRIGGISTSKIIQRCVDIEKSLP
jgi:cytidyltransferase-like protein